MENHQGQVPEWLKKLQENSWELELLISGGAIFSLFQLSDVYLRWMTSIADLTLVPGFSILIMAGVAIINMLTIGFSAHLLSRAYWLALVCINYVFPQGVGAKGQFQKPFSSLDEQGKDLQQQILSVDRICGMIIFATISGALIIFGFILGFIPILLSESLFFNLFFKDGLISFLLFAYLFYFIDFLTRGFFRKIPYLSYLLYPVFSFYDIFTLRKWYARALAMFTTHTKWYVLVLASLVLSALVILATYLTLYRTFHWPNVFDTRELKWQMADGPYMTHRLYRDQLSEDELPGPVSIPSRVIENGYLEVFVRYKRQMDYLVPEGASADTAFVLSDVLGLAIDDSVYTNVQWYPTWNRTLQNIGMTAMIPIHHLDFSPHQLTVWCKTDDDGSNREHQYVEYNVTIPFWRDMYN
jgi:hypothetical protein